LLKLIAFQLIETGALLVNGERVKLNGSVEYRNLIRKEGRMNHSIKPLIQTGILGSVAFVFMLIWFQPAWAADQTGETPQWEWTKEFPEPSWWRWDDSYSPITPVRGGILSRAKTRYIGLANPNHFPVNDWPTVGEFYEKLFNRDGRYKVAVPWLAHSWRLVDSTTFVMKLKKGINFIDGTPFNAEAVKYQIGWIKDKKNGCWTRSLLDPIKAVEVVDEYTVRFRLNNPWAGFIGVLSDTPGYMISPRALKNEILLGEATKLAGKAKRAQKKADKLAKKAKKNPAKYEKKAKKERKKADKLQKKAGKLMAKMSGVESLDRVPVGSGPYIWDQASPGNYLTLKRNPNWWFGKSIGKPDMPYHDALKMLVIPDPQVRIANLKVAKIHELNIDRSQYAHLKGNPDLQVYKLPRNSVVSLLFNHTKGPCQDIRVRKAISHAIDRRAIVEGALQGFGRVASCMFPEDHWTHNPNLPPVKFDPELSKKLLAEAGHQDGLSINGYMPNDNTSVAMAQILKAMLGKVNISWDVQILDTAAWTDRLRNKEFDLGHGSWPWIFDPDLMATGLYHPNGGFNFGRSANKAAIPLVEAGRQEMDVEKRKQIYWKLEEVLYNSYEDIWLYWEVSLGAQRKEVQGINRQMEMDGQEGYWMSHPTWFKDGKQPGS